MIYHNRKKDTCKHEKDYLKDNKTKSEISPCHSKIIFDYVKDYMLHANANKLSELQQLGLF